MDILLSILSTCKAHPSHITTARNIEVIMVETMDSSNIFRPKQLIRTVLPDLHPTCSKANQWKRMQKENEFFTMLALFSPSYRFTTIIAKQEGYYSCNIISLGCIIKFRQSFIIAISIVCYLESYFNLNRGLHCISKQATWLGCKSLDYLTSIYLWTQDRVKDCARYLQKPRTFLMVNSISGLARASGDDSPRQLKGGLCHFLGNGRKESGRRSQGHQGGSQSD